MEPVTAVLLDREHDPRGLSRMVGFSLVLHGGIIAMLLFGPGHWLGRVQQHTPAVVMSISLGSGMGPMNGGANPMGGRPVQAAVSEPPSRPQAVRPPAAKTPEMTLPVPSPKVKTKAVATKAPEKPQPEIKTAPEGARGRIPVTGPQEKFGSSLADTGVAGLGIGLSTGGGGTGGGFDIGNFCCPDYIQTMVRRVGENWNSQQQVVGTTVIRFTILRDGRITSIEAEQSSGSLALDLTAQRALQLLRQLPPLPAAYTEPALTVHLTFKYRR
ncbi:MAG TPA: TonB family protein [Vicinamibacterales bacterium]|jgi:protein TonB